MSWLKRLIRKRKRKVHNIKKDLKLYGDPKTTGRRESASERKHRRRNERRVPECAVEDCKDTALRDERCYRHQEQDDD